MFKIDIDDLIFFETEPVPINFSDLLKTENSFKIEKIDDDSERRNGNSILKDFKTIKDENFKKILDLRKSASYFRYENKIVNFYDKKVILNLTDHNSPIFEFRGCRINSIIDHHEIENSIKRVKKSISIKMWVLQRV
ncbi:hypothetical protein DMUE_3973 [Dictyocoela muelleri]|nr:hypothetical protein DMUE_3973 [Dictyocoela muelleri]